MRKPNICAEVRSMKINKTGKNILLAAVLSLMLCGCGSSAESNSKAEPEQNTNNTVETVTAETVSSDDSERFTERDLQQTPDLENAVYYTVSDGENITISEEGVYVLSGSAEEVTVAVDAADDAKVQIVLDGVSIKNTSSPVIYVKHADKVFVTTTDSENIFQVTGSFSSDGDTNTDGVIFSKDDLVLNGGGTLTISSSENGVVCKDDLKITGGTYYVTASSKAFEANDSILINDGTFSITAGTDGFHSENDEDDTKGELVILGGTFNISAKDDALHGQSIVTIEGGTLEIEAGEGIESTQVTISDGTINITAADDGINAGQKSKAYDPVITISGGNLTIEMAAGDTDAIDSNGDLYISGGSINITAQSPFDYDGTGEYTGGTIIVNGATVTSLTNQMMGGFAGQNRKRG